MLEEVDNKVKSQIIEDSKYLLEVFNNTKVDKYSWAAIIDNIDDYYKASIFIQMNYKDKINDTILLNINDLQFVYFDTYEEKSSIFDLYEELSNEENKSLLLDTNFFDEKDFNDTINFISKGFIPNNIFNLYKSFILQFMIKPGGINNLRLDNMKYILDTQEEILTRKIIDINNEKNISKIDLEELEMLQDYLYKINITKNIIYLKEETLTKQKASI